MEKYYAQLFQTTAGYVDFLFLEFIVGLIPILTYMVVVRPHDCYKCVGKDPERTYSIWQTTDHKDSIDAQPLNSSFAPFEFARVDIAENMDEFYGQNKTDVTGY